MTRQEASIQPTYEELKQVLPVIVLLLDEVSSLPMRN